MPDERVVIKIEVKSDDKEIDRTRRKLERLAGANRRDEKRRDRDRDLRSRGDRNRIKEEFKNFDGVSRKYKKRFDSFDKMIRMTGQGLSKFLGLTIKGLVLEMAAMGVAMMGIHLLFGTGRLIMKAYHGAMKMVAAGMAGVAIAAGTAAAAIREQQAAMFAFAGRGQAAEFGSALNQTRVQMRALTMDADLASVGIENLVAAYGEVVKGGTRFTTGSKNTLKGLMDFASAGMDLKEGTKQAGALIATLQDTKKSYSDVVSAGKKFSPQLKKALEEFEKGKGSDKTKAGLTAAIRSGELAKLGGVDGQFGAVSGTLIATLKGEFNMLRGQFADFGQSFLAPMKKEAKESFAIITRALQRMNGQVTEFGKSGFIDKISVVVGKISDFVVRTMRDFLPGSMGIFERIGNWWDNFTDGWNRVLDVLRPFIEGARVFEGILKSAWLPVWEQIKKNMYDFNNQLLANEPQLRQFGTNFGEMLVKVMEYFSEARKLFFQSLPFINKVIKGFTSLIELFTSFLGGFTKLTGGIGGMGGVSSLIGLMGLARGMKNTKGYFTQTMSTSGMREVANMNVNARVIYVNGKPMMQYGVRGGGGNMGIVKDSNSIRTSGGPTGVLPFRGAPGYGTSGGGFSSRGGGGSSPRPKLTPQERGELRKQFGGHVRAGQGIGGGHLITSGPNAGATIQSRTTMFGNQRTFLQFPPGMTSVRQYGPGATYDPNSFRGRFFSGRLYNNFLSPTSALNGPKQYRPGGFASRVQGVRLAAGHARQSRLGGMVLGNENRKGLQGSATGGIGVGLGLGALANSGMVSEEAQGFLSAGAMIGMYNPLAGLGIGLGGAALTSKTVGGGAVSGAAAGAAIGTMIAPGFGTAAGAIIGTAVGGLMGGLNKVKEEKKKVRAAFQAAFDNIFASEMQLIQRDMIASGGVGKSAIVARTRAGGSMNAKENQILDMVRKGASGAQLVQFMAANQSQFNLTDEQIKDMRKRPEESLKVADKLDRRQKAQNHLTDIYQKKLEILTRFTGKTEQEVERMASTMGVDLYDATKDFHTVLEELGVGVAKTREQLRGLQMDIALAGLDQFAKAFENLDAPNIVDEQSRAFRDALDEASGEMSDSDFATFIKDFMPNLFNFAGGGLQGMIQALALFGPDGTEFSRKEIINGKTVTSPFYGERDRFNTGPVGEAFQSMLLQGIGTGSATMGGEINARLIENVQGQKFMLDSKKFSEAFGEIGMAQQLQLLSDLESGRLFENADMSKFSMNDFSQLMKAYGLDGAALGLKAVGEGDELQISLDKMPEELRDTYQGIIDMFSNFFDERDARPDWMTDKFIKFVDQNNDTSTPRGKGIGDTTSSRLAQTMGRHAALDGMLTGTRNVTSSYREFGLGSINSDHVTGRAYDLVGQNLGAYQRLVHANGGFAEFHGANGGRHLHVVPGPLPFGDMSAPKTTITRPLGGKGGEASPMVINMTVNGNTDAQAIADAAVVKLKLALSNERQRR